MRTLPLDRFPVLRTAKLDEVRAAVWAYLGEHPVEVADPDASLDAKINGRILDRLSAGYVTFGAETRTEPGELGLYLVQLVVSGAYRVSLGDQQAEVHTGGVVVLSPDRRLRTHWSADCGVLSVVIRAPHLVGHLSGLLARLVSEPLRFDLVMDVTGGAGHSFDTGLLRPLLQELNRSGGPLEHPANASQVEDALLTALLRAQPNTYSRALERALGRPAP